MKETRGPKVKLTPVQVRRLNAARKDLIHKAAAEGEVHIADVMAKAKINHVSIATVSKHFKKLGVSWKAPREAPLRMKPDEEECVHICSRRKRFPNDYFTDKVDGMWDNKKFDVALHPRGKRYLKMKKVRGHLRTRAEGVARHFTKPKSTKNRVNPGTSVNVCAGIINCRVRVWEYLPERWCADAAVKLYEGPIIAALRKHRGTSAPYTVLEDNDPSGYKANAAKDAKLFPSSHSSSLGILLI